MNKKELEIRCKELEKYNLDFGFDRSDISLSHGRSNDNRHRKIEFL